VEAALTRVRRSLRGRAELQTVALEDIASRLQALAALIDDAGSDDAPSCTRPARPGARVRGLADNAQAFMAGVARSLELQQADATAVVAYKRRLIDYLERFIGDLVRRSEAHRQLMHALPPASIRSAAARRTRGARRRPR
jgi:uncharacterized protein (TIGR02677 family)